ncbi:MAG: IPExxxVDY family protein [Bacteroidetes bacterium]|nr:IPExxxVDY family protein [Bacteroidota bacterium]
MKKLNLDNKQEREISLFGIVCDNKISKLAWLINNTGFYGFGKIEDLDLSGYNPADINSYMRMQSVDDENHLTYILVENKNEKRYLVSELKNLNYLLIVKGGLDFFEDDEFIKSIKKIPEIKFISSIEPKKLKSKLNLIL